MSKHVNSIDSKLLNRIRRHGRGWAFTASDFLDLGVRGSIDQVLRRLSEAKMIRKVARGVYDYPRKHKVLGILAPSIDAVAKAVAGSHASRLQPSGAYAANLLGLSEQVPMKIVFLTEGNSRRVDIGKQQIILKRTTPKNVATAGRISGLVIQALRHIGKDHVNETNLSLLRQRLSGPEKKQLLKDIHYAPTWIAKVIWNIVEK